LTTQTTRQKLSKSRTHLGYALTVFGLVVFWSAVTFGIRHIIPDGFLDGIINTTALIVGTTGFFLLFFERYGYRKAILNSISIFLASNILVFEVQLYFNPYPDPWWTRQASDWLALLGLGHIITNELVFVVAFVIVTSRIILFIFTRDISTQ
jgi:hypothetical protein